MSRFAGRVRGGVVLAALVALVPSASAAESWSLSGSGWGHGVGMSQYGALEMARDGLTARQILGHYYTGTTYDLVPDTAEISVNLLNNADSASMTTTALSDGGGPVTVSNGTATITGGLGATLAASAPTGGVGVTIKCATCTPETSISGTRLTVTWDNNRTLLSVAGKGYRDGRISVTRSGTTAALNVVAQVRIHDEYLDYVTEVPWSWPGEALRAQAAAARGYALSAHARGLRASCDCHLFNTTVSQVFAGYPSATNLPYWQNWTAAVRAAGSATQGYVVRHNGTIVSAYYSSSSGGRTQNNEDVWGGAPLPYLRSVDDPWSLRASNPRSKWSLTRTPVELAKAFGLSDVAKLDLSRRHASTGVARATATSAAGVSATISGELLRSRLGLYSTYVARTQTRLGGPNRYATAVAVASTIPLDATAVVVASGEQASLIDATVGGPLAGAVGGPILLTEAATLPEVTRGELARRGGPLRTAYILGGEGSVSATVAEQLRAQGLEVIRLGGANRYSTARLVAAEIARLRPVSSVMVAAGHAIPDVVSSSGPSAALGQPILLTDPSALSADAQRSLTDLRPRVAYLAGGGISAGVETDIGSQVASVTRLSGSDRFDTAAAIARHFAPQLSGYDRVVISSGADINLVDAISAGALKQPMLLVRPTALPAPAVDAVQRMPAAGSVTVVGGAGAVSDQVALALRRS